jgi:hypothetical protein
MVPKGGMVLWTTGQDAQMSAERLDSARRVPLWRHQAASRTIVEGRFGSNKFSLEHMDDRFPVARCIDEARRPR